MEMMALHSAIEVFCGVALPPTFLFDHVTPNDVVSALREDNDGTFAGLDLKQPETWARIDAAMSHLMTRAYGKAPL
jgi:hypothetical protein